MPYYVIDPYCMYRWNIYVGQSDCLMTMHYVTMEMAMTRDFVPEFAIAKMQHESVSHD